MLFRCQVVFVHLSVVPLEVSPLDHQEVLAILSWGPTMQFQKGEGCDACNGSGYSGRQGLYEVMPMTAEQKDLLLDAYKTDLFPKYGRSAAVQRIPMNLVEGERLRNSLDVFIRKGIVK